jgi:two-component system NtrC family sensor kinase
MVMMSTAKVQIDEEGLKGPGGELDPQYGRETVADLLALKAEHTYSERLSAISHFTTHVASQMNDCLTPIICYAQVISQSPEAARFESKLKRIVQAADQARRIMDGLLDFSSGQSNATEKFSVDRLIRESIPLFRDLVWLEEGELVYEENKDLPSVVGDKNQIIQALLHLLKNANQARTDTKTPIVIRAFQLPEEEKPEGCVDPEPRIVIEVEDQGCGIPEGHLSKVLLPFFTTRRKEARGLGLSIVYGIVDSHGGDLEVYSREGKGTRVRIVLPTRRIFSDARRA